MTENRIKNLLLLFLPISGLPMAATSVWAETLSPPLLAEYRIPSGEEDIERMITVRYAGDGTSIVERHKGSRVALLTPEKDDNPYVAGQWIAGPMTGFQAGRMQKWEDEIGTNFVEVDDGPGLEAGVRYVDNRLTKASEKPGRRSWSYDDLEVTLSKENGEARVFNGLKAEPLTAEMSYVQTNHDADGSESGSERITHRFRIWISKELPFSPLPFLYEPFRGNLVPPYTPGPVAESLINRLVERIRNRGGLVRAEVVSEEETVAMEITDVRKTPEPPMEKYAALPVVSGSRVSAFAGPMFLTSLLRDSLVGSETNAVLRLGDRELSAVGAWKTNDVGDLVIALSAKDENTTLFLLRPVSGLPEPGAYGTAEYPGREGWGGMSDAEKEQHLRQFQLFGVVAEGTLPTVLTAFESGEVEIVSSAEDGVLAGAVRGTVESLPTGSVSEPETIAVEIEFEAEPGLEKFRFRSNEARLVKR